jgi:uncharacterized protein (TIGR00290 family)
MLCEDGLHSRSHGLPKSVLEKQATALRIPIEFGAAAWSEYESVFISKMKEFAGRGIGEGVFGDIDIEAHRQWEERVCGEAGMKAVLPLWQTDRIELLSEFISAGFKAIVVTVKESRLNDSWLGRTLDHAAVKELRELGVDASGENGEYHTFVYDGPIFKNRITYIIKEVIKRNGYASLRIDE